MDTNTLHQTAEALRREWQITIPEILTEATILQMLADKIVTIIQRGGPEAFFQLMYRIDVPEQQLNTVLTDQDAPMKIARLVYDRQLQKIKSRLAHTQASSNEDADMKW